MDALIMQASLREVDIAGEIAEATESRLREFGGGHFYGAWHGGSKAAGGKATPRTTETPGPHPALNADEHEFLSQSVGSQSLRVETKDGRTLTGKLTSVTDSGLTIGGETISHGDLAVVHQASGMPLRIGEPGSRQILRNRNASRVREAGGEDHF